MSTSQISITLETKTIKHLDQVRGLTKRSTLIENILSAYLEKEKCRASTRSTLVNQKPPTKEIPVNV